MKCAIISLDNKEVGSVDLSESVFGVAVRADLLSRMVNWQLAKRRAGTHKTRDVSEIWKPALRPVPRRCRHLRPRRAEPRLQAAEEGAQARAQDRAFGQAGRRQARGAGLHRDPRAQDEGQPKTRDLVRRIENLGWSSALVIDGAEVDENFKRAAANIPGLQVLPQQGINVYDILRRDTLVLTKQAVSHLEERLK
jgi:large subunit ribosomal protein L4